MTHREAIETLIAGVRGVADVLERGERERVLLAEMLATLTVQSNRDRITEAFARTDPKIGETLFRYIDGVLEKFKELDAPAPKPSDITSVEVDAALNIEKQSLPGDAEMLEMLVSLLAVIKTWRDRANKAESNLEQHRVQAAGVLTALDGHSVADVARGDYGYSLALEKAAILRAKLDAPQAPTKEMGHLITILTALEGEGPDPEDMTWEVAIQKATEIRRRLESAGCYHGRTPRENEIREMLDKPVLGRLWNHVVTERDTAIVDLLELVDCGRNRVHLVEEENERLKRDAQIGDEIIGQAEEIVKNAAVEKVMKFNNMVVAADAMKAADGSDGGA